MALSTGSRVQCLGMTGSTAAATMVHAAAAFIGNPRVRTAVFCRPILDRVAGDTIQAKKAGMIGRVCMTARTDRG
jgi:hypothetical protein